MSKETLAEYVDIRRCGIDPRLFPDEPFYYYNLPDFDQGQYVGITLGGDIDSNKFLIRANSLLISKLNPRIRRVWLARNDERLRSVTSTEFVNVETREGCHLDFLYYYLQTDAVYTRLEAEAVGTTNSHVRFKPELILRLQGTLPPLPQQRKIAKILTTVDNLIEKTEALIAKYEAVKQGMMHDLFTRGVDEHGHLRPTYDEAPELYKESELGWIPREWEVAGLKEKGGLSRPFLRTGPFGSSLKGEHWVEEGVPVVTIGALGEGYFIEKELLYISHAYSLRLREYVLEPSDIVFSRVADVGRSVVVTEAEHGWIMSSNLMRISLDPSLADPHFTYLSIAYSQSIRDQIRQTVNAGGREVANSNVMGGLRFAWPPITEQHKIAGLARSHDARVSAERRHCEKLRLQKTGLMQDLLTGKVRVKVDGEAEDV